MSDLFDRVAMRVLGSQANLRPRRRTRFEPMLGPESISNADFAAPTHAIASLDNDPLAAPATALDHAPSVTARRKERSAGPLERHDGRDSSSLQPISESPTNGPRSVDVEGRRATEPHLSLEAQAREAVSAETDDDPAQPILFSATSKGATEPASVPPPAARRNTDAVRSSSTSLPVDAEWPARDLANVEGPTPARATETITASAPIVATSRQPIPTAPTMGSSRLGVVGESQGPTDSAVSSPDTTPLADPLGVRARARIEQRPSGVALRMTPAPASTPPVEVTIGRLEIRAGSPPPPPSAARAFAPHLDLAAYRARKEGKA